MGTIFGEYLKALRETSGLTLRDVEKKTEVSNAYLSQLEQSKVKQPSPITLHKLAELYGVSYALMMEKAGYPSLTGDVPVKSASKDKSISYRVGNITDEEEIELINYLKFIRSKKR